MNSNTDQKAIPTGVRFTLSNQLHATRIPAEGVKPVLLNDLYQYVTGHSSAKATQIEEALKTDLALRANYRELVRSRARLTGGKLQAARSPAEMVQEFHRKGDGFEVHIAPPGADEGQCYVTLTVHDHSRIRLDESVMLHVDLDGELCGRRFPALINRSTQLILDLNDRLLDLLKDDEAELYVV